MEEVDPRQAVVLCDSYETRFGPLSVGKPKALFPVGNDRLIHHVLRFLSEAGVRRTFLICSGGVGDEEIRHFVEESAQRCHPMITEIIITGHCLTLGDALRDLDSRKIVTRHDFLLVRGDVIGNMNLNDLLKAHKEHFQRDKGALMTMVMSRQSPQHPSRTKGHHDDVFVMEKKTGKLLHRQNLSISPKLSIPSVGADICIRNDLCETGIYICGPGVPPAFSDNFDFQTMGDFVKGILNSEEILGSSLYVHIAAGKNQFASRLDTPAAWNDAFADLANRRALSEGLGDNVGFWNIYRATTSEVHPGAKFIKNVFLSPKSVVSEGAALDNCFVGADTKVGSRSCVTNSQVWAGSKIGSDVIIRNSIIGENVTVGDGIVCDGCILGPGVCLYRKGEDEPLRLVGMRLSQRSSEAEDTMDGSSDESGEDDYAVLDGLAPNSKAYRFRDDRETEDDANFRRREKRATLMPVTSWIAGSEDDEGTDDEGSDSENSEFGDGDHFADRDEESGVRHFEREVADSLTRGMEEALPVDNLVLEINSSKHAYNIGFGDVVRITTREVLRRLDPDVSKDGVKKIMGRLWGVIANYVKKSGVHVVECLKGIEEYAAEAKDFRGEPMVMVLNILYSKDVLSERGILEWNKANFCSDLATGVDIRSRVKRFIEWLETAETESESGEDSEGGDEDSE